MTTKGGGKLETVAQLYQDLDVEFKAELDASIASYCLFRLLRMPSSDTLPPLVEALLTNYARRPLAPAPAPLRERGARTCTGGYSGIVCTSGSGISVHFAGPGLTIIVIVQTTKTTVKNVSVPSGLLTRRRRKKLQS
ncbi:hypothetical protein FRX31_033291 [Thalictrum thalictroides]|uniref:Uncharacterized protein n=1 Tax=Thalictrum thalictroides TaxID=46969 RepID=A0A7J6UX27_THATH|nr:hypothetical protein FRX31_033291 [Thalictrum thalictroides]